MSENGERTHTSRLRRTRATTTTTTETHLEHLVLTERPRYPPIHDVHHVSACSMSGCIRGARGKPAQYSISMRNSVKRPGPVRSSEARSEMTFLLTPTRFCTHAEHASPPSSPPNHQINLGPGSHSPLRVRVHC
jgi:hypothetical protein